MAWKTFLKDYLIFTKKERLATLVVIFLLAAMFFLPRLFSKNNPTLSIQEDSLVVKAIDTLRQTSAQNNNEDERFSSYPSPSPPSRGFTEGALFHFDPNTLPAEGWQKLGLNDKTIRILINYRTKGGHFYKPEDLKKVWTMPAGFYERVKDQITLPTVEKLANYPTAARPQYAREESRIKPVNINKGDTADFIALPGIGPVLAGRIIKFRDKLGGFHTIDQLAETYGLPDTTFQKLKPYFIIDTPEVRKLNLNTASKEDLSTHPYISWKLANALVEYRNQHGNYQSIEDVKNILILDEATFLKIKNYLVVE